MRNLLISAFCILNIATVVLVNTSPTGSVQKSDFLERHLSPHGAYRIRYTDWLVRRYAHLVGLDNQWTLFSTLPRFDWWYVIKGKYSDGSEAVLPLPLQSRRPFLERMFFDHKEAKLHLNIYNRPDWRAAYGRFLCREAAEREGRLPASVVFELHHQQIRERREAARLAGHLDPTIGVRILDTVPCAGVSGTARS